jgi:SAM-dependent methyltransferase
VAGSKPVDRLAFADEHQGVGKSAWAGAMTYQYDTAFFDFVDSSSGKSASLFIDSLVRSVLAEGVAASVLDIGCGRGVWLAEWKRLGSARVRGVDGDYVDRKALLIPAPDFHAIDISQQFDLQETFDLVQCLEVAEHVPEDRAETLVGNLVRHGDLIVFSAAIPGQGGEFHVNERPYSYWRTKFADRGYEVYDAIRPVVAGLAGIEPWYRYNAFVYANARGASHLTPFALECLVPRERRLPDVSPAFWRLRCAALAAFPPSATSVLARVKHRAANLFR